MCVNGKMIFLFSDTDGNRLKSYPWKLCLLIQNCTITGVLFRFNICHGPTAADTAGIIHDGARAALTSGKHKNPCQKGRLTAAPA